MHPTTAPSLWLARSRVACLRGLATLPFVGSHPGLPLVAGFTALLCIAIGQRAFGSGVALPHVLAILLLCAGPFWGLILHGAAQRARVSDRMVIDRRMMHIARTITDACSPKGQGLPWRWEVRFHGPTPQVLLADSRTGLKLDHLVPADILAALPDLFARARLVEGRTVPKDLFSTLLAVRDDGQASAHTAIGRQHRMRALLGPHVFDALLDPDAA